MSKQKTLTRNVRKDILSMMPGFFDGFASVFGTRQDFEDFQGTDEDALRGDWEAVGKDMKVAFDKYNTQWKTNAQ